MFSAKELHNKTFQAIGSADVEEIINSCVKYILEDIEQVCDKAALCGMFHVDYDIFCKTSLYISKHYERFSFFARQHICDEVYKAIKKKLESLGFLVERARGVVQKEVISW